MTSTLLAFADLLSAFFGMASALTLGLPLLRDVTDRRQWDTFERLMSRDPTSWSDEDRAIRDLLIAQRLGDHRPYRKKAIWGFGCLLAAFGFALIAAAERLHTLLISHPSH